MITHVISTEHSRLRDKSLCVDMSPKEEGESIPFPDTTNNTSSALMGKWSIHARVVGSLVEK